MRHDQHHLPRGFTLVEILIVLIIMAIISVIAVDSAASFEASSRGERAARETLACFRFTRGLAMSTGKKVRLVLNSTTRTFTVQWNSSGDGTTFVAYTSGMTSGGNISLNLSTARELAGTTFTFTPANPGYFEYGSTGTCAQTGTVTFTYAGRTKTITVPNVGDPQIN